MAALEITFLALLTSLVVGLPPTPIRSDSPTVTVGLCRAHVQPCQEEVNLLSRQTIELDLLLLDAGASPLPVVAWEVHLKLTGASSVEVVQSGTIPHPVLEQGDPQMALHGLQALTNQVDDAAGQYFAAQNRYLAESGQLDYVVALLRASPAKPGQRVAPVSNPGGLRLGRITVQGVAQGSVTVTPGDWPLPFQAVAIESEGELVPLEPLASQLPLARINVDPDKAPVLLQGQLPTPPGGDGPVASVVSVSFWEPGATPVWQQGTAVPVAVFSQVSVDSQGGFQVSDIVSDVLPPGAYDVRVKAQGALSQSVLDWHMPASSENLVAIPPLGALRHGDVDGDDSVDEADLAALQSSFATQPGSPAYNALADFNADQVVDGQDFSTLALSFHQLGE